MECAVCYFAFLVPFYSKRYQIASDAPVDPNPRNPNLESKANDNDHKVTQMDQINILELCLEFLNDPKEVFKCRLVCLFWCDVIEYLIKNTNSIEYRWLIYHRKIRLLKDRPDWIPGWNENGLLRIAHLWRDLGVYFQIFTFDNYFCLRVCEHSGYKFHKKICEIDHSCVSIRSFEDPYALIAFHGVVQTRIFKFSFEDFTLPDYQVEMPEIPRRSYEYDWLIESTKLVNDCYVITCDNDKELSFKLQKFDHHPNQYRLSNHSSSKSKSTIIHYLLNDFVFLQKETFGIIIDLKLKKAIKIEFPPDFGEYHYFLSFCEFRQSFVMVRVTKDLVCPIPNFFQLCKVLPKKLI